MEETSLWELMIPKLVHSISAFQNGRLAFASANYYRRWITPANWIRRMFTFQFHCISHQGTMSGFMVGESLQVFLLMLRLWTIFGRYSYNRCITNIMLIFSHQEAMQSSSCENLFFQENSILDQQKFYQTKFLNYIRAKRLQGNMDFINKIERSSNITLLPLPA